MLQNLSDIGFDLSKSLKMKSIGAVGLPTYGFLLMLNSSMCYNSALLRDIRLQILSDLEFDLLRLFKVKRRDPT